MNSRPPDAVNKVNRIILGIFLLFVIFGAGVYGSMKFMGLYKILTSPMIQSTTTSEISIHGKMNMLESVANSDVDIEEVERLSTLRDLDLKSSIDVKSRSAVLGSLR